MKVLPVIAFVILIASCADNSQPTTKPAASATTAEAAKPASPYTLPVPAGWGTELFTIPIEFAPQIPYKGSEELRFAPGWGDTASAEHWSYFFLWWLENNPSPDTVALQQHLTDYYNGLVGRNIKQRNIPKAKVVTTKATIKKEATAPNDTNTYTGTVYMLNYLKQEPITLNVRIHERKCGGNHTALFFEISPQPATHAVWETYKEILGGFTCK
jgi:hypothetical protein